MLDICMHVPLHVTVLMHKPIRFCGICIDACMQMAIGSAAIRARKCPVGCASCSSVQGQQPPESQAASWRTRIKLLLPILGRTRKQLIAMAQHASSGYQDTDYEQYLQQYILPVAEDLLSFAREMQQTLRQEGEEEDGEDWAEEDEERGYRGRRSDHRQTRRSQLTGRQQQVPVLDLDAYRQAPWRYPPLDYVVLQRRNVMAPPLAVSMSVQGDSSRRDGA